ncbi:septal ring factor EnvC (AmiA/AmiB activator) [Yoonia maritima]|uniref:Septal ring factor EnvC (AmiA/AmiB activator) n=1 Tax=Yoonia maritima TaxID=1435347 RepID=A0A2T0VZ11_9RHOB|nr:peptidoglycan DD-metalloendopeptidase family protein [Yoonia maritima]PRY77323.1 septal ring factor EnvC (AmiA/AmiB activator) [Yoonia maritima]
MRLAAFLICLALPAFGQTAGEAARDAMAQLQGAQDRLQSAGGARDQIKALTETVQSYEAGLAAVRSGLRQVAAQEAELSADLSARRSELGHLIGALSTISNTPEPVARSNAQRPIDAVRAGMLVADVTEGLQTKAEALRSQLSQIQGLRDVQAAATENLEDGLTGAQDARAALAHAISERSDLPTRFEEDTVQIALLMASSDSLGAFADALANDLPDPDAVLARQGNLPLPVRGIVQSSGRAAEGVYIAAVPQALVTSPVAATLLYRGPLLGDVNVVILEPAPDVLFIFAGLETLYGDVGQIIPAGTPLGLMGGDATKVNGILTENETSGTDEAAQPLYLEVREGQGPVNPDAWFALE